MSDEKRQAIEQMLKKEEFRKFADEYKHHYASICADYIRGIDVNDEEQRKALKQRLMEKNDDYVDPQTVHLLCHLLNISMFELHDEDTDDAVLAKMDFILNKPDKPLELTKIPERETISMQISKASRMQNEIAKKSKKNGMVEIPVGNWERKTADGKGNIQMSIIMPNDSDEINEFDIAVQDAVGSLIYKNNGILPIRVTVSRICAEMHGVSSDKYIGHKMDDKILESIEKMRSIHAKLDFTQQEIRHHQADFDYTDTSKRKWKGYLLNAEIDEEATLMHNGVKVKNAWVTVYTCPFMYKYSHVASQIATFDYRLLNSPNTSMFSDKDGTEAKASLDHAVMKRYILRELTIIAQQYLSHGKRSTKTRLLYDGIVGSQTKTESVTEKQWRTIKKNTKAYLDQLYEQDMICGYVEIRNGRKPIGYEIKLDKKTAMKWSHNAE